MTGSNTEHETFRDPAFVERLRTGEAEAAQAVIRAYLPQIVRAARGAGLPADEAEDVAQATFLTFLNVVKRFEGRSHVRTFLFGILYKKVHVRTFLFGIIYKKVAEKRRGQARERRTDSIDDVMESRFSADGHWHTPPRPIDERFHDGEVREQIDGCLEGLSLNQRMAFVLRESEGPTTEEIGKILDVSRTNLGVLLYRARNRLRECLEAKGVKP